MHKMSYGKLKANLSESGNIATFTLSITRNVRRPDFQTPVVSPGATIWANVFVMVNLKSVEHPQQHFIIFLPFFGLHLAILQHSAMVGRRPMTRWD